MKNFYAFLVLLLALTAPAAHAQRAWQPFRPGLSYQYSETTTPGDTTHVLQLGAGTPVLGTTDTIYRFSGRAVAVRFMQTSICGGNRQLRADNLFGATLQRQAPGVFMLMAANGRGCTLRPTQPVGQSWPTGLPGLSAQVITRTTALILNATTDSVVAIRLSDGQTLTLSKFHGLLAGPSLDSYLNGRNSRRNLVLTALPNQHLGAVATGPLGAFDYQVGDVFQYYYKSSMPLNSGLCVEKWTQDSIMTRTVSRTGDTITYATRHWERQRGYGVAGAPSIFCGVPTGITVRPPYTSLKVVRKTVYPSDPQTLTAFFSRISPTSPNLRSGILTTTAVRNTLYNGRLSWGEADYADCAASVADSAVLGHDNGGDYIVFTHYADGLGIVRSGSHNVITTTQDTTVLTAYRKGSETWGTFFPAGFLLAARLQRPASTTAAFPNPFGSSLTARFELARPQAVTAELRDALGRTVQTGPATALGAGPQQLTLPTVGLPAGIYALHLRFGADGHSEVLRVVRE